MTNRKIKLVRSANCVQPIVEIEDKLVKQAVVNVRTFVQHVQTCIWVSFHLTTAVQECCQLINAFQLQMFIQVTINIFCLNL